MKDANIEAKDDIGATALICASQDSEGVVEEMCKY